ncbi:hypothetical protein DV738_g1334, partial [Chaetothyriales sp. CBS 135597]
MESDQLEVVPGSPGVFKSSYTVVIAISIIRTQRRPISLRKGGVSFTAATITPSQHRPPGDLALVLADSQPSDDAPQQQQRQNRFVPPTGQLVDVDRHMTAYIDSRLSRHKQGTGDDNQQEERRHLITQDRFHERHNDQKKAEEAERSQGKGVAATRRLKPGRVKPRRPRQRPEQDMARDALVEKLLAEHAPGGHYSAGANPIPGSAAFAARFRAAFFDRASERRSRGGGGGRAGGAGGSAADKDKVKTSHGPKLGGSRSDKAKLAMIIAKKQERAAAAGK